MTTTPSKKRTKLTNDNVGNHHLAPITTADNQDSVITPTTTTTSKTVSPVLLTQESEISSSSSETTTTPMTTTTTTSEDETISSSNQQQKRNLYKELLKKEANYDCYTTNNGTPSSTTTKRTNYLTWDDYFMAIAALSAHRSKDPIKPTGACIVDEQNRVIGIGYSGFPQKCSDDALPWKRTADDDDNNNKTPWLHTPEPYACHAEVNAILNKCSHDTIGATMYVDHFPTNECAKMIIQSQIKHVVYRHDHYHDEDCYRASRILFEMAGVQTRHYTPTRSSILLDFRPSMAPAESRKENDNDNDDNTILSPNPPPTPSKEQIKYRSLLQNEARGYDPVMMGSSKRTNYLSWDDYFMAMAFLTAQRSKDPNTQVGACIVHSHSKRILGLGYNGFPRNCSDDVLPWARQSSSSSSLHTKYPYVCHAEVNAILNKGSSNVQGSTLYVALFPCNECAKMIIQSGIQTVVYLKNPYHDTDSCRASRILFQMAGVQTKQYMPNVKSVLVEF